MKIVYKIFAVLFSIIMQMKYVLTDGGTCSKVGIKDLKENPYYNVKTYEKS